MSQGLTYVVFAGKSVWKVCAQSGAEARFVDVTIEPSADAGRTAELMATALRAAGYTGGAVLLAIPSAWCYVATISLADLPRHDRKAMLYRLEEGLPFAAERLAADFLIRSRSSSAKEFSDTAMGVCCRTELLEPILTGLELRGISVQSVTPADLLAVQEMMPAAGPRPVVTLCADCDPGGEAVNVFGFEAGLLTHWSRAFDGTQVQLQVDLVANEMDVAPAIESFDADTGRQSGVANFTSRHADRARAAAARIGREILLGNARPWIEMRRGPLAAGDTLKRYRRPLNAVLASAVLLLIVLAVVLEVRAVRYRRQEESARREIISDFQAHFPGWAVPPNAKAVIESEHRKAAAFATAALPAQARLSALRTLHDVLSRLPVQDRLTLEKLTFNDNSFEIQGEIGAYEQVDAIAAAVRLAGLDVPAPEARKTPAGLWSFVLRGSYHTPSVAKGG